MSNTEKRIYFNTALWEVKNKMLRLQVRIDEYAKAREARRYNSIDTPLEPERIAAFLVYLLEELRKYHGESSPVYNQLQGFIEKEFSKKG